jgi:hypothetical protein
MVIQPFYGKEPHIIVGWFVDHMWKNDIIGISNCLNYCVICKIYT